MIDPETGELRQAWAFVFTLSWSRHQYVEFVFDQRVETWLRLHRNALAFLGGVPKRIVIDNLKAGIARGCWSEPQAQQPYRECAACPGRQAKEHYNFLIAPCRPRTPEHKGKVAHGSRTWIICRYCDAIPNPPQTTFLRAAEAEGAPILDGLGMLVYQGAIAFQVSTGVEAPIPVMRYALEEVFRS